MEHILINRDYVPNGRGGLQQAAGTEALLARALFCLCCRRGSFPFLPELGSRLWQLKGSTEAQITSLAAAYCAEAVSPLGLKVETVKLLDWQDDAARLDVALLVENQTQHVEVTL